MSNSYVLGIMTALEIIYTYHYTHYLTGSILLGTEESVVNTIEVVPVLAEIRVHMWRQVN